jgi:hypothetical protein
MEIVNEQRCSADGRKQSEENKCKLGMANSLSFLPLSPSVPSDSSLILIGKTLILFMEIRVVK